MDGGTTAARAAGGMTDGERAQATVSEALEALRRKWGACMFGHDERGYWAARPDVIGSLVRAGDPDELDMLLALLAAGPGADPS